MENKQRVLIAGIGQSNFLKQLYASIHKIRPDTYEFDIIGLKELSGKDEYGFAVFNKVYEIRETLFLKDFKNIFDAKLLRLAYTFVRYGLSLGGLRNFIKKYLITKSLFSQYDLSSYHTVHIHFPTFHKLDIYWHLSPEVKCIISFWGSDLMRNSGLFNYYIQSHVTERANIITTHGNELKQQILTKFGRNLDPKVLFTRFPPFDYLYKLIDEKIKQPKTDFEYFYEKYSIPTQTPIVVIGHNGAPENNHLKIIECLANLSSDIKLGTYFILPFSYKASKQNYYETECVEALKKAGLKGILLREFLSWEDLAILKRITDIMIHMPVSDALSGALTEALFAGSEVITANWLPYSPFTNEGLTFKVTDFKNLKLAFADTYYSLSESRSIEQDNRDVIKNKFLSEYCAETWLPIFDSSYASS